MKIVSLSAVVIKNPLCIFYLDYDPCLPIQLQVRLVRVTKRVHEAYFAQLYLTKVLTSLPIS